MSLWIDNGTVAVTNGSPTVTGTSTTFVSLNALPGYAFRGPNGLLYEILSVNSETGITLSTNYAGTTASGQSYAIIQTSYAFAANILSRIQALIAMLEAGVNSPTLKIGSPSTTGVASALKGLRHVFENTANVSLDLIKGATANTALFRWFDNTTQIGQLGLDTSNNIKLERGANLIFSVPSNNHFTITGGVDLVPQTSGSLTAGQIGYGTDGKFYARDATVAYELSPSISAIPYYKSATNRMINAAITSSTLVGVAGVANNIELAPMIFGSDISTTIFGVRVSTAVASAQGKIVLYDSDANGQPTTLLMESTALDFSTTGYKNFTNGSALSFRRGKIYWFGIRHSSTASLLNIPAASVMALSYPATPNTVANTKLVRSLTFATAAPASWTWVTTEEASGDVPSVWARLS